MIKFEPKKRVGKVNSGKVKIVNNKIILYKDAMKALGVSDIKRVNFYFGAVSNHIGIEYSEDGLFKLTGNSKNVINAKRFFKAINAKVTGKFDFTVQDNMLLIDLAGGAK